MLGHKGMMQSPQNIMPNEAVLKAANVHPATGLATDYLNVFNEYIMLAELVADGTMDPDILADWQPIDYESHFVQSGFAGVKTVLAAYRALDDASRIAFETATNTLIDLILDHQLNQPASSSRLGEIEVQRDMVAAMISGPQQGADIANEQTQSAIDALFD